MADVRLYILAGTFLAVIIAFIWFVVALVRARRMERRMVAYHNTPSAATSDDAGFDTDLEGLEVEVKADAPSAALLTPLRTGEWVPSDAPSADALQDVTLERRIDTFQPAPNVPEPAFNVQEYQPWEVGQPAPVPAPGAPVVVPPMPMPVVVASVPVEEAAHAVEAVTDAVDAAADTVEAAVEAVEPAPDAFVPAAHAVEPAPEAFEPAPDVVKLEDAVPAVRRSLDDLVPKVGVDIPSSREAAVEPIGEAPVEVASALYEQIEEDDDFVSALLEEAVAPEDATEGLTLGEASSELGWTPPVPTTEVSTPVAVVHTLDVAEDAPVATEPLPPEPQIARPAVRVTSAEPPVAPSAPVPVERPRRVRPVVTIGGTAYAPQAHSESQQQGESRDVSDVPELVMQSPVEMWFGDARVGVKAGSATYDRFRKYADVLLEDLKASKAPTR